MSKTGVASTSEGLLVPLWVEQEQWMQGSASVEDARESARLQEAQLAMLSLERFFADCPEVGSVQFAWGSLGTGRAVLMANACGVDGSRLDGEAKLHGAACAYARGQASSLGKTWPEDKGRIALVVARERPFDAVGPILLGPDLFGSWMSEREAREIRKGLGPTSKSSGKRPL